MHRQSVRIERRSDHPERIHDAHEQYQQRDVSQCPRVALVTPRQQKEPWNEELKRYQQRSRPLPAMPQSAEIPVDLFRNITRPYDQQLRKREIGPEHEESEQEIPKIMKMVRTCDICEGRPVRQKCEDDNRK